MEKDNNKVGVTNENREETTKAAKAMYLSAEFIPVPRESVKDKIQDETSKVKDEKQDVTELWTEPETEIKGANKLIVICVALILVMGSAALINLDKFDLNISFEARTNEMDGSYTRLSGDENSGIEKEINDDIIVVLGSEPKEENDELPDDTEIIMTAEARPQPVQREVKPRTPQESSAPTPNTNSEAGSSGEAANSGRDAQERPAEVVESIAASGISSTAPPPQQIPPPDLGLSLNAGRIEMDSGETRQLVASGASGVSWSSSDSSVATVGGNGIITARGSGAVVVTASANGVSAACTVYVR